MQEKINKNCFYTIIQSLKRKEAAIKVNRKYCFFRRNENSPFTFWENNLNKKKTRQVLQMT